MGTNGRALTYGHDEQVVPVDSALGKRNVALVPHAHNQMLLNLGTGEAKPAGGGSAGDQQR